MTKKRKILLTLLITATLSGLMLTGCSSTQTETKTTSQSSNQNATTTDNATYGKVTAVSGNDVTLAFGTLNQNGQTPPDQGQGQTPPDNSTTATGNNGSTTPPEKPSGNSDTTPGSAATTTGGQATVPDLLTMTGETTSITLSDAMTITKMNTQKSDQQSTTSPTTTTASATDITVGSILKITYKANSTEIEAIEIMTPNDAIATQQ
jgi:uncharacterized protein YceK